MSHYKKKTSTTQRIYNFRKRTYLQKYSIHYTYIPRVAFIPVYERTHIMRTIYQNQFAILYEVSIKYNLSCLTSDQASNKCHIHNTSFRHIILR